MFKRLPCLGAAMLIIVAVAAQAQPTLVEGVPNMTYVHPGPCYQIASLWAALMPMGADVTYDELMVHSGAAFRMAWWPGTWSYGAPVVAPEDILANGAAAVGYVADSRTFPNLDDAWAAICGSIDDGRPVLQMPSWGTRVICGYEGNPRRIRVQSYNEAQEYVENPLESWETPHPFQRKHELVLLREGTGEAPEERQLWLVTLRRAVRFARQPEERLYERRFVIGHPAYEAWARELESEPDLQRYPLAADLNYHMIEALVDARSAAFRVLWDNQHVHEAFATAADYYDAEAQKLGECAAVFVPEPNRPWAECVPIMRDMFALGEAREQAAALVREALELDKQAVAELEKALKGLSGEEVGIPGT